VGLVFGIGFDTATEVVPLAATAYAAIQGLPYFAVLALPFLFSGGLQHAGQAAFIRGILLRRG
jgi:high-affinity nickel-transport protein